MPLKSDKLRRSIWLYSRSLWLGLHYVINKGLFWIKLHILYSFYHALNPENWIVASFISEQALSKVIVLSPVWTVEDTRELMYISHPFYSWLSSLSGPFRIYACRSWLLKLVLINCILWKVQRAHQKCIIRFLPFWLRLKSIWYVFLCHKEGTEFSQANVCFSCIKHWISWRNGKVEC